MHVNKKFFILSAVFLAACSTAGVEGTTANDEQPTNELAEAKETAEAQESEQAASGDDLLVVGSSPTVRPLEYMNEDNEVTGLVVDLLEEAASRLDVQLTYQTMSFDALIPALQSERIGMITQMGQLPDRRDAVSFIGFLDSGAALMVAEGNPHEVSELDDLCGLEVAFTSGSSQQATTEEANASCIDRGEEEITQAAYEGASETILALQSGQADAAWTDVVNASFVAEQNPGTFETVYRDPGFGYGIGIPRDDEDLLERFVGSFEEMHEDGTYDAIVAEWGLEDNAVDEILVNNGEGLGAPDDVNEG